MRPSAVTTSASEMPPATELSPPEPVTEIFVNAAMMPTTVPSRPTNGATEPTDASTPRPRRRSPPTSSCWR